MAVMVIELDRTYYRPTSQELSLVWLALALAIGCFGAMLALFFGPLVGLAPALMAVGLTVGFLGYELERGARWQSI